MKQAACRGSGAPRGAAKGTDLPLCEAETQSAFDVRVGAGKINMSRLSQEPRCKARLLLNISSPLTARKMTARKQRARCAELLGTEKTSARLRAQGGGSVWGALRLSLGVLVFGVRWKPAAKISPGWDGSVGKGLSMDVVRSTPLGSGVISSAAYKGQRETSDATSAKSFPTLTPSAALTLLYSPPCSLLTASKASIPFPAAFCVLHPQQRAPGAQAMGRPPSFGGPQVPGGQEESSAWSCPICWCCALAGCEALMMMMKFSFTRGRQRALTPLPPTSVCRSSSRWNC